MAEPKITINGIQLTPAQAMAIRVGINSFAMKLGEDGLGDDEHGKEMTKLYMQRIGEINKIIGN